MTCLNKRESKYDACWDKTAGFAWLLVFCSVNYISQHGLSLWLWFLALMVIFKKKPVKHVNECPWHRSNLTGRAKSCSSPAFPWLLSDDPATSPQRTVTCLASSPHGVTGILKSGCSLFLTKPILENKAQSISLIGDNKWLFQLMLSLNLQVFKVLTIIYAVI